MATVSNTVASAAGDIVVSFESGTDTFQLLGISDIEYDWDINNITSDAIDRVGQLMAGCSVKCLNEMDSGTLFTTNFLNSDKDLTVTIGSYVFPMRYTGGEYDINDISGVLDIKVKPSDDYDQEGTSTTSTVFSQAGNDFEFYLTNDMIEDYLASFGESTFVNRSNHFTDDTFPSAEAAGGVWAIEDDSINLPEAVNLLARAEGAIYGTGFNQGFFVSRINTSGKVTITQDDILDIKRNIQFPDLATVTINLDNASNIQSIDVTDTDTIIGERRQDLTITASIEWLNEVYYDDGNARLEIDTTFNQEQEALNITADAITSYETALRATAPFEITVRVEGFDTIKPWEPFDITDTTGKLSAFTGKTYRPSRLSYSIDNEITLTAYAIA